MVAFGISISRQMSGKISKAIFIMEDYISLLSQGLFKKIELKTAMQNLQIFKIEGMELKN